MVKTEAEKTARLRAGLPVPPVRHGQSAKTMGGGQPVARKSSTPGTSKKTKSVGS